MLTAPLLLQGDPGQEQEGAAKGSFPLAQAGEAGNLLVREGSQEH